MDEREMVREKDEVGESETESLQDKERAHLQYVEMANGNDTKEALTDISMVSTILFIATMYIFASGMRSFLIPQKGVGEYRRRGSLCSDGSNCLYAELLTMEERKVGELEEKLGRSVDELTAVREAHLKFVSEVRSIAETKRYWKSALQVLTNMDNIGLHWTVSITTRKALLHQNG